MDTPPDDDALIAVEIAGKAAGISPRTLRYWISNGKQPATAGSKGKLVRMRDIRRIAALTGRDVGSANDRLMAPGNVAAGKPGSVAGSLPGGGDHDNGSDDGQVPSSAVSSAARSQLEAIRDEWLLPLVEQIREQAEQIGRLSAERDAEAKARAEAEILRLAAEQDAALEYRRRQDEADQADQIVNLLEDRIRELERRLRGER